MAIGGKSCPVCGTNMMHYENPERYVCPNVKAHGSMSTGKRNKRGTLGLRKKGGARKGAGRKPKKKDGE